MDTRSYLASELQNQWESADQNQNVTSQQDNEYETQVGGEYGDEEGGATAASGRRPRRPLFGIPLATGIGPLDLMWASINESLLISKVFYFFFYSAFGSLFPLLGVYFKQLGMDAFQAGILSGVRPLVEMISAPFWSGLADRFRKNKPMLLFSLFCWIIFTSSLAFIRPPASACVFYNETHHVLSTPYEEELEESASLKTRRRRSADEVDLWSTRMWRHDSKPTISSTTTMRPFFEQVTTQLPQSASSMNESSRSHPQRGNRLLRAIRVTMTRGTGPRLGRNGAAGLVPQEESITLIRPDHRPVELHRVRFVNPPSPHYKAMRPTDTAYRSRSRRENYPGRDADWKEQHRWNDDDRDPDEHGEWEPDNEEEAVEAEVNAERVGPNEADVKMTVVAAKAAEAADKPIPTMNPKTRHRAPPNYVVGKSPMPVDYTLNYDAAKHVTYVSPTFSSIVYKWDDVREVFFLLVLLTCLGEFFSSPAITLADTATINYLGDNIDQYSRQRMFGSVGWGITMFFVGMALDNSVSFPDHPCGAHERERNYKVCFTIFSVLMFCAWLVATRFQFDNSGSDLRREPSMKVAGQMSANESNGPGPRPIFNTAPPINVTGTGSAGSEQKHYEFLDKWKSAVFAQRSRGLPPWITMVREFANPKCATFFLLAFFLGLGIGMVFSFLFWHLQDIGGTPTLFGYASVINHISEILAYFFSLNFIKSYGHKKVLCLGLACNVVRFTYIAFLFNAWFVLPMEFLQGVTHAACWATMCSYMNQLSSSPSMRGSGQAVLQTLHHGLGKALGAILGGLVISYLGSRLAFFLYAVLTLAVLALFVWVHCYTRGKGLNFMDDVPLEDMNLEEAGPLGPHGVPSGPVAAALAAHGGAAGAQSDVTGGGQEWTGQEAQAWDDANQQEAVGYMDPNQAWA